MEENEAETAKTGSSRPQLHIYPVPAADKLSVKLPMDEPASFRLLNIQGMELRSGTLRPEFSSIDVQMLAPATPAMYILYVQQAGTEYSVRFVKQ
ncbi:MAG: T9SS type A sorting domain-containing protein [Bacteroidia bacterium]|nr:T9SS type A sorting domain-containing protein [Bacteroidia bacterium]